jgi:hypothetical protein
VQGCAGGRAVAGDNRLTAARGKVPRKLLGHLVRDGEIVVLVVAEVLVLHRILATLGRRRVSGGDSVAYLVATADQLHGDLVGDSAARAQVRLGLGVADLGAVARRVAHNGTAEASIVPTIVAWVVDGARGARATGSAVDVAVLDIDFVNAVARNRASGCAGASNCVPVAAAGVGTIDAVAGARLLVGTSGAVVVALLGVAVKAFASGCHAVAARLTWEWWRGAGDGVTSGAGLQPRQATAACIWMGRTRTVLGQSEGAGCSTVWRQNA